MTIVRAFLTFLIFTAAVALRAQSTVPALSQALPTQSLVAGGPSAVIDLRNYFTVPGVTGQVVQFDTVLGKFNIETLAGAAPQSVANFLGYVGNKSYSSTIFHRAVALGSATTNSIVQGGGFDATLTAIATTSPVALEYNLPNTRGTIAMARNSDPNSATSQWFFNVQDNTTALGASNGGGYAVFGRVLGTGMTVVDSIAALPTYNLGDTAGIYASIPLRNVQSGQTSLTSANLIVMNSVTAVPIYPVVGSALSLLKYSGTLSAGGDSLVTGVIYGSTLTLTPVTSGSGSIVITAADINGNGTSSTLAFSVAAAPVFTTQPVSQTIAVGGNVTFTAAATASASPSYQWQVNGTNLSGLTTSGFLLSSAHSVSTGLYTAVATSGVSNTSAPAIFGVTTTNEVIDAATVLLPTHILHPNGNYFDQVLLTGAAATITAVPGQATRTSYIDDNDEIVQVEFSGNGSLSLVLDNPSGPAAPVNYNQAVNYMKGHAGIVISGADDTTNVSVFSVGRSTAFDPTSAYNIIQPISATNVPANNGSPLFQGHASTVYPGFANIAFIAISSVNGKFGGVRTSNAKYTASKGYTGVYAPGVAFTGPVFVGNIVASGSATPLLIIGSSPDTRITGGDLLQANGQPVQVGGLTQLKFTAGGDSNGNTWPESYDQSVLLQNNVNVTGQVVVY
jgi:cyclophilin family peptidyl-prolyl cis-trans isomerase